MDVSITQNVEALDLVKQINYKKKLYQRLVLNNLEEILGKESEEFKQIRKLFLDSTNDFSRSIVKAIFGDSFEGYIR